MRKKALRPGEAPLQRSSHKRRSTISLPPNDDVEIKPPVVVAPPPTLEELRQAVAENLPRMDGAGELF